jgi:glycosyltransferase involved in cell wall biosynthesis
MNALAFTIQHRPPELTEAILRMKGLLKEHLAAFIRRFEIDLLIVENALTIPMNLPLGLALTEYIAETGFPTIAHHHDFYWERDRFLTNCVPDYLAMAFPPRLPSISHVVINSQGANQLSLRTGISAVLIPNVMEFEQPPQKPDGYAETLAADLGLSPGQAMFLQPTRIVQRKGIEHAIELVRRTGLDARLVITHAYGDEPGDYQKRIYDFAALLNVPLTLAASIVESQRGRTAEGRKIYSLADAYQQANLVTYPSTIEGFGNAFLEAIYYCKPIVVNTYSIYDLDIKPKGFQAIEFDGYITDRTVEQTRAILETPALAEEMTQRNYQLGLRYYSFKVLERHLKTLLMDCFGEAA